MNFEGGKLSLIKKKVRSAQAATSRGSVATNGDTTPAGETKISKDTIDYKGEESASPSAVVAGHKRTASMGPVAAPDDKPATVCSTSPLSMAGPSEGLAQTRDPMSASRTLVGAPPMWAIRWTCGQCKNDCIPVRSESRCLCGHRLKEHKVIEPAGSSKNQTPRFQCCSNKCSCKHFFYIVAEGAWILRCRCKHKHVEHDCAGAPFRCKKASCNCSGFDSPWVCNCGHPWNAHNQTVYKKERINLPLTVDIDPRLGDPMMGQHLLPEMTCELIDELDLNYRKDGVA